MNYIMLISSYGQQSMKKVVGKMKEPCHLLSKFKNETWNEYDPQTSEWTSVDRISEYLEEEPIINWGNHTFSGDYLFELNVPSAVALASNKRMSRRILQEAGVPVPKSYFWDNLAECIEVNYPIIVRPSHHHAGKDFNVFYNPEDLGKFLSGKSDWYASEVFEKTHEFRVHAAHGKILVIHEKPLVEGELRANYAVNQENWRALKWSEFIESVSLAGLQAVETLGLDYGAVDVMYNSVNGQVAVAEVNTSPQITADYTSGKYAEYFDWAIRHNFPAHFVPEGTSVFYNNILRD